MYRVPTPFWAGGLYRNYVPEVRSFRGGNIIFRIVNLWRVKKRVNLSAKAWLNAAISSPLLPTFWAPERN
jgi:hypothetical protein